MVSGNNLIRAIEDAVPFAFPNEYGDEWAFPPLDIILDTPISEDTSCIFDLPISKEQQEKLEKEAAQYLDGIRQKLLKEFSGQPVHGINGHDFCSNCGRPIPSGNYCIECNE